MRYPVAFVVGAVAFTSLGAQATPASVTVRGLAYDSLRAAPLAGAFISIAGTTRTATSDARGRFSFEGVAPGSYVFVMHHDVLDSIGFSGRTARAVIDEAHQTVTIAVPSFSLLWRAACGGGTAPRDSGLVYGFVRSADGERPVPGARVGVIWRDVTYQKKAGFDQKDWGAEVTVDSTGQYALCGVPQNVGLQLVAATDSLVSGRIALSPLALRVARRDFLLSAPARVAGDSTAERGVIIGDVTGDGGRAVAGAIVFSEGLPETRSGEDGRFVLRDVPAGTRQVEVRAIGAAPYVTIVDVRPRDTTTVAFSLSKVVTLEEITVKARRFRDVMIRDIAERRRVGLGYFRDSTEIGQLPNVTTIFDGVAGLRVRRGIGSQLRIQVDGCDLAIWIDRQRLEPVDLYLLTPDAIATIETYTRPTFMPPEFKEKGKCGAVVVWTKRFFR